MNICEKEKISKRKCFELAQLFSKLPKKYSEDKDDEWIENNDDIRREDGYGWVYLLHTCITEDIILLNLINILNRNLRKIIVKSFIPL
jgi:hypothetical protein